MWKKNWQIYFIKKKKALLPVLATGLGALFGTMYLDSKLLLSRDLDQIGYVLKSLIKSVYYK